MKKVLLIGGTGGLGRQLHLELQNEYQCISVGSKDCNVTNENNVKDIIHLHNPEIIIYLSAKNIDGYLHKQSSESINSQLNVSLIGFLNILRHTTELMREKGYGRIIYISSILSKKPIRGTGIYSASKAFCDNLIKTYSLENSKYGITANSIQLGYFQGGLTDKVPSNILEGVLSKIPLKRLGNASEIGNVVKAVIKTEYINGTNISVTGGYENE